MKRPIHPEIKQSVPSLKKQLDVTRIVLVLLAVMVGSLISNVPYCLAEESQTIDLRICQQIT